MVHQATISGNILQVSHQTNLEENNRINAFLAALPVKLLGQGIQELKVEHLFQTSIEIFFWNSVTKKEGSEEFFLIILFTSSGQCSMISFMIKCICCV